MSYPTEEVNMGSAAAPTQDSLELSKSEEPPVRALPPPPPARHVHDADGNGHAGETGKDGTGSSTDASKQTQVEGSSSALAVIDATGSDAFMFNPIQDDTWVRHTSIVCLDNLKEPPHEERAKNEVLQAFRREKEELRITMMQQKAVKDKASEAGEKEENGDGEAGAESTTPTQTEQQQQQQQEQHLVSAELPEADEILRGMAEQEEYMQAYKKESEADDRKHASAYKTHLMESYRKKHSVSETTPTAGRSGGTAAAAAAHAAVPTSTRSAAPEPAENGYPTEEPAAAVAADDEL